VRTLALASLGGVLEFYDFVIFVFFAGAIGHLFFPASQPDWLRQVQTFGLFAAGYFARPLGGVVMAHFGDTVGRKRVFTLSVLLMAIPTLLIGLMPTYAHLGPLAPLLLLVMRLLQGAAIGGEAPGGWVFVAEHARRNRTGLALGLLTGGLTGGILLGSVVAALLTLLAGPAAILAWAWRVPFLLGGVFGLVAMMLRRWLSETPVFEAMRAQAEAEGLHRHGLPLGQVLSAHRRAVLLSMACTWMLTATIVVVILMAPVLLQKLHGVPAAQAQGANLLGTALLCLSAVSVGAATDRWGTRAVALAVVPLLVLGSYGLFGLAGHVSFGVLLLFYALAGLGAGLVSLVPVVMVRLFPPPVRFSGLSFSYNVAYALFGGITPPLVSWLGTLDRLGPAHYVAAVSVVGLLAVLGVGAATRPSRLDGAQPVA
jgi:MFS family permease